MACTCRARAGHGRVATSWNVCVRRRLHYPPRPSVPRKPPRRPPNAPRARAPPPTAPASTTSVDRSTSTACGRGRGRGWHSRDDDAVEFAWDARVPTRRAGGSHAWDAPRRGRNHGGRRCGCHGAARAATRRRPQSPSTMPVIYAAASPKVSRKYVRRSHVRALGPARTHALLLRACAAPVLGTSARGTTTTSFASALFTRREHGTLGPRRRGGARHACSGMHACTSYVSEKFF